MGRPIFVDASAVIALLSGEVEAERVADALEAAETRITSPVAVLEMALALARPDKFNRPIAELEPKLRQLLERRDIVVRDMPPAAILCELALSAAQRFRGGRRGLNLGDCLHYACARHFDAAMLSTAGEFRKTDLQVLD